MLAKKSDVPYANWGLKATLDISQTPQPPLGTRAAIPQYSMAQIPEANFRGGKFQLAGERHKVTLRHWGQHPHASLTSFFKDCQKKSYCNQNKKQSMS